MRTSRLDGIPRILAIMYTSENGNQLNLPLPRHEESTHVATGCASILTINFPSIALKL